MKPVMHFPAKVTFAFQRPITRETIFTPESWRTRAEALADVRDHRLGPQRCLVAWPNKAATNSPEEHVIPQASGIRWIRLPRGLVSQPFNSQALAWELEFFRKGIMGPYVRSMSSARRKSCFATRTTTGSSSEIPRMMVLGLRLTGSAYFSTCLAGGPGAIRFRLPIEYPPTRVASRAITKIAYLVLAVINPDIAFSDALSDVRAYLVDDHAPYRAYGERFCPQGPPRVSVSYWITGRHIKGDQCEIASIIAKILIHHVQYLVHLVGDWPDRPAADEITWHVSEKASEKRTSTLTMNYDEAAPTPEDAQPAIADGVAAQTWRRIAVPARRRPHR